MNLIEFFSNAIKKLTPKSPTPADFRRGVRKHKIIGYLKDPNSKHAGTFQGKIKPMKRRFRGVSLTSK